MELTAPGTPGDDPGPTYHDGGSDGEGADGVRTVAAALGWESRAVLDVLGGGWRAYEVDVADEPHVPLEWFIAGEPVQLMLGLDHDRFVLTVPEGRWTGVADLRYAPVQRHMVWLERDGLAGQAQEVAASLQARRRRSFRWCPRCRRLVPPEERFDVTQCMGCASRWDGVAF